MKLKKILMQIFRNYLNKKQDLFRELDSLLMETYQTSPVLIDDTRLVAGEEGCLVTIDLEFVKNKNKEGLFDPRKMSSSLQRKYCKEDRFICEFTKIINQGIGR